MARRNARSSVAAYRSRTISTFCWDIALLRQAKVGEGAFAVPVVDTSCDLSLPNVEEARIERTRSRFFDIDCSVSRRRREDVVASSTTTCAGAAAHGQTGRAIIRLLCSDAVRM